MPRVCVQKGQYARTFILDWEGDEMWFSLLLFYGGIAGMIGTALLSTIVIFYERYSRRKLRRKLKEEYGE